MYYYFVTTHIAEKPQRSIDEHWRSHEKHLKDKSKTRERLQPIGAPAEHSQEGDNGKFDISWKIFKTFNLNTVVYIFVVNGVCEIDCIS